MIEFGDGLLRVGDRLEQIAAFPAQELERMAKAQMLGNVTVVRETKVRHNEVPLAHLADLLKAAACLDDR